MVPELLAGRSDQPPGGRRVTAGPEGGEQLADTTEDRRHALPLVSSPAPRYAGAVLRGLLIALGAVLAWALFAGALVHGERSEERARAAARAEHAVDLLRTLLEHEHEQLRQDLVYLAGQDEVLAWLDGGPTGAVSARWRHFAASRPGYVQVRLLDAEAREVVRLERRDGHLEVTAAGELQPKGERYYVRAARTLERGEVYLSPLDLNVEDGVIEHPERPVLRGVLALWGGEEPVGFVVLNASGAALLERLQRAVDAHPGTPWLLNADGHALGLPGEVTGFGAQLGSPPVFPTRHPDAWVRLQGADDGGEATADGWLAWKHTGELVVAMLVPDAELERGSTQLAGPLSAIGFLLFAFTWPAGVLLVRAGERRRADAERLHRLSARLLTAQEEERRRLSRELHDGVAQQITALRLQLLGAARHPERAPATAQDAAESLRGVLRDLQALARGLRPSALDDLGLRAALEALVDELAGSTGVRVESQLGDDDPALRPDHAGHLYRCAQEAVSNAIRHAGAQRIHLALSRRAGEVLLEVRDDGRGFDPAQPASGGLGLQGLRERAELMGGGLELVAAPGRGTIVRIRVPEVG